MQIFVVFLSLLLASLQVFAKDSQHGLEGQFNPPLSPVSVQLHWHHQFEFAGLYAAIQQGYYREAGLEVTLKDWRPGISSEDEVASKRVDFAVAYSSSVVDYIRGKPIRLLLANFQVSPMVLLSKEPIYRLEQLSGKTVMDNGSVDVDALIFEAQKLVEQPIKTVPPTGKLEDFIDGKVDLFSAYQTNEPFRLRKQGIPFYLLDPKSFGIQSLGDVVIAHQDTLKHHRQKAHAFKEATIKGWKYAFEYPESVVDFILQNYPVEKTREALMAEASEMAMFVLPATGEIGDVDPLKVKAAAKNAFQVGLITNEQYQSFIPEAFIYNSAPLNLTSEEMEYLSLHPQIQIGNDSYWEPFEFVNDKGEFSGISADYFALMSEKLGVEFKTYQHKLWDDVILAARNREAKILSCAVATPERKQFMNFTEPYLSFPLVLVAKKEVNFIDHYDILNSKTVAVPRGYWSEEWFKDNYPKINLLPVTNVKEGLEAVLSGNAYAFSGNLASINFAIKRYGLDGLHIVGEGGARFELAIGVDKQDPVLFSIMKKALASITPEERDAIYKKWIQLELVRKTDHSTLIAITLGFLLILSIFAWLLWLLKQKDKQQAFYIGQVNELSMATYTNFKTGKIEWVSESFLTLSGCQREQILGQSHFALLHPEVSRQEVEHWYRCVQEGETVTHEVRAKGCHGEDYWVELTASPKFEKGKVVGAWVTRVNITDKKRLEQVAIHDALTGVYNRHQFNELFDGLLNQAHRSNAKFSVLLFDIDYFKSINDQLGHQQGDQVLVAVAQTTRACFGRTCDFIFRIGGEEFIVVSDFSSAAEFESHLLKFKQAIHDLQLPNPGSNHQFVTVSIGALFIESFHQQMTSTYIYSQLDELMYAAKSAGRDQLNLEVLTDKTACQSKN